MIKVPNIRKECIHNNVTGISSYLIKPLMDQYTCSNSHIGFDKVVKLFQSFKFSISYIEFVMI
jgi:hypothetical protein